MGDSVNPFDDHDDQDDRADRGGDGSSGQPDKSASDALSELLAQLGLNTGGQPLDLNALMAQLQQVFGQVVGNTSSGSGVDWTQAKHATRRLVAGLGSDPSPLPDDQRRVADAARLAELWLDEVTSFRQVSAPPASWSRAQWVEETMDSWQTVSEPIVTSIANAMAATMSPGADTSGVPGMSDLGSLLQPMLRSAAGAMYAGQLAQTIAQLATEVLSGTEIGLPLLKTPRVALLSHNIEAFTTELALDPADLRLYLALREAARQRLYAGVAWLSPQILALLGHYARLITIDQSAIHDAMDVGDIDELTPEKLEEASKQLQGRLFAPTQTPEQQEILGRLETLLALVEGWVDEVTAQAAQKWLPDHATLSEAVRRRRATNAPAQKALHTLVGLDVSPRRIRDANNLWAAISQARGVQNRDQVWAHPDMIPTATDLDDPMGYVSGDQSGAALDDLDEELAKLLQEEGGEENSS